MEQYKDVSIAYENTILYFKVRDELGAVSDTVSDRIILREAFGENTYSLKREDFNGSGVMVDIGANIGAVSILGKMLGAKTILAFEPEPQNREMLLENIKMNRLNIEVSAKAIWSSERVIKFVPSQGASTANADVVAAHKDQTIDVETITLEEALKNFADVDVLKCDAEGAEYELFFNPEVNKKARKIVIEFHTTTQDKFGALLATLSLTHNVQAYGNWRDIGKGGQILALRY